MIDSLPRSFFWGVTAGGKTQIDLGENSSDERVTHLPAVQVGCRIPSVLDGLRSHPPNPECHQICKFEGFRSQGYPDKTIFGVPNGI